MEPSDLNDRAVSPELVLIDPELAARERAAIPWHPWPRVPRIALEPPAPAPPARRRSFAGGFLALGVAAAAAVTVLSVVPTPDRPTFAARTDEARQSPAIARPKVATVRRKPTTARPVRQRARKRPVATTPRRTAPAATRRATIRKRPAKPPRRTTTTQPKAKAPAPKPSPRSPRLRRPAPVQLKPAPSFAWAASAGAVGYQVLFTRNARTFYKGTTRAPRIRLPARLRFRPGVYRWVVWPLIPYRGGPRRTAPIVDSTFRVNRD